MGPKVKLPTHLVSEEDANHWEKGDHLGARFDLCTVYGHINQQLELSSGGWDNLLSGSNSDLNSKSTVSKT